MRRQLNKIFVTVALLAATTLALAGEAGRLMFATGSVLVAGQPASTSHVVMEGDTIVTGTDGHAHLKTIDDGYLIVRPGSHARVVAYHVDSKNPANNRIKLELVRGIARSISGQAVQQSKENFRFNTPVAAIGVRGTDFTVYTDQTTSRVVVATGGVTVSGFTSTCGPSGSGPCQGANSRELFANQTGQLLQVLLGQPVPQLLRSTGLAPDLTAPPAMNEPKAKASSTDTTSAKDGGPPTAQTGAALIAEPLNGAAILPDPYGKIIWGRWQPLLGLPANIDFVKGAEAKAQLLAVDSYFAVLRTSGADWQVPSQGTMSFALKQSEAFILTGPSSTPVPATLENGLLKVDFAKASFATGFDLVSQSKERFSLKALGDVSVSGLLQGASQFSNGTNMQVNGAVGPQNGGSAAYIFQSRIDNNQLAIGAAAWVKK